MKASLFNVILVYNDVQLDSALLKTTKQHHFMSEQRLFYEFFASNATITCMNMKTMRFGHC